ncbi:MAG: cell surface protein SprA, partial [Bacteroidota bacterium]
SENAFTGLRFISGWRVAAAPADAGPPGSRGEVGAGDAGSNVTDPLLRGNWRGLFAWYSIAEGLYDDFEPILSPATLPIPAGELFDERQFPSLREAQRPLDLLDLYFDPTRRGPYNFNRELSSTFANNPRDVWGGFVRQLETSYSNFDGQNNIEFVELLLSPLGGINGTEEVTPGSVLYLDLGQVQEDILPNGFLNTEDGLQNGSIEPVGNEVDSWSRRAEGRGDGFINMLDGDQTEDLGLDGLASEIATPAGVTPYAVTETTQFGEFLASLPDGPERRRSVVDPSGDDYYFFDDPRFNDTQRYPSTSQGATIQERYAHYFPAFELNSTAAQQALVPNGRGVAVQPNSEDINGNNTLDPIESFHRYTVPLDAAGLSGSPFLVNTLTTEVIEGQPQTWYLLRIPVRTQNKEIVNIEDDDFSRIEAVRVWTTGHERPVTIRVASFELVGSQWLKSDLVGFENDAPADAPPSEPPALFVETINNEEDGDNYAIPRGTLQNIARSTSGQITNTREQSLVFRAEGLADGRRAGLVRSFATRPIDLTKYSNLRLDIHGNGFERADSMFAFVRFGDDETENYYELEQPVYPFDPSRLRDLGSDGEQADSLWQTNVQVGADRVNLNPINVVFASLNDVKLQRDRAINEGEATVNERFTVAAANSPPGATVTVRGQPSIQDVRTMVLGVRNGSGGLAVVDTVSIWFNELRATGYDEAGAASGFLTATLGLADVASVNARLSFTQDGFGELGGALGGRNFSSETAFTLTSQFSAHKLLPERYGWQIPVSFSLTQNESTPRFDPDNGDVRLSDLVDAARGDTEGDAEAPELVDSVRPEAILERAQTATSSTNFRVSASKSGSRSPWLRYTIDGLTASYTLSNQGGRNPSSRFRSNDSWTGNLAYRVTVPRPLTVRPFWLLGGVPVARDVLGGLRLNLLPQSVTLSADANRNISVTQPRLGVAFLTEPDSILDFRALARRTQRFEHGRQASVQYTPFPFLQLSFASTTDQDLGGAGQSEQFKTLVVGRDSLGRIDPTVFYQDYTNVSPSDVPSDTTGVLADLADRLDGYNQGDPFPRDRLQILGGSDLTVFPLGEALSNAFNGGLRTRAYDQRTTATLRISTARYPWLSWLQLQPINYSAEYDWQDQPSATAPDLEIASAGTRATLQTSVLVRPRTFWRLFPFYRAWEGSAGASGGRGPVAPAQLGTAADSSSGGGFSPFRLLQRAFLGLTSIDDITVTYRGGTSAATGGLEGQAFSLWSGFTGAAPPLGYRLGLTRSLGADRRITDDTAFDTFTDLYGTEHDVDARTQFSPLRGLNIGLNMRTAWNVGEEVDFNIPLGGGEPLESFGRRSGANTATVLGFGGSYDGVVARQVERYREEVEGNAAEVIETEFLSPTGLADDFTRELARGSGSFGSNGLFSLPLPNWTVTYSGLERLPILRLLATQVSVQHGYSSTSESRYATLFDPEARLIDFS